jgi:hypothetical protein
MGHLQWVKVVWSFGYCSRLRRSKRNSCRAAPASPVDPQADGERLGVQVAILGRGTGCPATVYRREKHLEGQLLEKISCRSPNP